MPLITKHQETQTDILAYLVQNANNPFIDTHLLSDDIKCFFDINNKQILNHLQLGIKNKSTIDKHYLDQIQYGDLYELWSSQTISSVDNMLILLKEEYQNIQGDSILPGVSKLPVKKKQELKEVLLIDMGARTKQRDFGGGKELVNYYLTQVEKPEEPVMSTKIQFIDDIGGGGIPKGSFTIIAAPSDNGKSRFLTNLTSNFASQGYRGLHITLEDTKMVSLSMIMATNQQQNYTKLVTKDKEFVYSKTTQDKLQNFSMVNLAVIDIEWLDGDTSIQNIQEVVKRYKYTHIDERLDFVTIDYIQKITVKGVLIKEHSHIDYICTELRNMASLYNCVVISATQLSKEGFDKSPKQKSKIAGVELETKIYNTTAFMGSSGIMNNASLVFGLQAFDDRVSREILSRALMKDEDKKHFHPTFISCLKHKLVHHIDKNGRYIPKENFIRYNFSTSSFLDF